MVHLQISPTAAALQKQRVGHVAVSPSEILSFHPYKYAEEAQRIGAVFPKSKQLQNEKALGGDANTARWL